MKKKVKQFKLPLDPSTEIIRRAVENLEKKTMAERFDIMVHAKLMTKEEAEKAKAKVAAEGIR